jgi:hypothetical protein
MVNQPWSRIAMSDHTQMRALNGRVLSGRINEDLRRRVEQLDRTAINTTNRPSWSTILPML